MSRTLAVAAMIAACLFATQSFEPIGRMIYDAGAPRLAAAFLRDPFWRGATLYAEGRFDEAAAAFGQSAPTLAAYDQGTALARAGRLQESIEAFNEALDRDPNDEDARYNLALVEALKEKRKRAEMDAFGGANASAAKQKRGGEAPASPDSDLNSSGEGAAGDRDSGRETESPGEAQVSRLIHQQQERLDASQGEARGSVGASEGAGKSGDTNPKVAQSFDNAIKLPKKSYAQQAVTPSVQWLQTIPDDPGKFLRLKLAAERIGRAERGVAAPAETDQW